MKPNSKRGVALAYVIVITAVLLILAAALISTAKFNMDSSTNSLEGRQAYLDAKSAIEFGREYLSVNPDAASADFSIVPNSTSKTGFAINSNPKASNAVAAYDSSKNAIRAAAKYKSSDRVRKLGYQFATDPDEGESDWEDADLSVGFQHGNNQIFNGSPSRFDWKNGTVYYAILANQTVNLSGSPGTFSAPQMYYTGSSNSNVCYNLSADRTSGTLQSSFFFFQGDIIATSPNRNIHLYLKSNSSSAIVSFNHVRMVVNDSSAVELNGFYQFSGTIDLINVQAEISSAKLKMIDASKIDSQILNNNNFVLNNYKDIVSGEDVDNLHGNNYWVKNGYIDNGRPSEVPGKIVFFYISDSQNWHYFANNPTDTALYGAKEIHFQYVSGQNFMVPSGDKVILKSDKISLNTQYSDSNVGSGSNRPQITRDGNTGGFILVAPNKENSVDLYVPNALTIQYAGGYTIKPGHYSVKNLNLFSDDARSLFAKGPNSDGSGGTGGSGGGTGGGSLTGGVYTNGQ